MQTANTELNSVIIRRKLISFLKKFGLIVGLGSLVGFGLGAGGIIRLYSHYSPLENGVGIASVIFLLGMLVASPVILFYSVRIIMWQIKERKIGLGKMPSPFPFISKSPGARPTIDYKTILENQKGSHLALMFLGTNVIISAVLRLLQTVGNINLPLVINRGIILIGISLMLYSSLRSYLTYVKKSYPARRLLSGIGIFSAVQLSFAGFLIHTQIVRCCGVYDLRLDFMPIFIQDVILPLLIFVAVMTSVWILSILSFRDADGRRYPFSF